VSIFSFDHTDNKDKQTSHQCIARNRFSVKMMSCTPCLDKIGPPKQNAVKCTVYNTIQCHLHSVI